MHQAYVLSTLARINYALKKILVLDIFSIEEIPGVGKFVIRNFEDTLLVVKIFMCRTN